MLEYPFVYLEESTYPFMPAELLEMGMYDCHVTMYKPQSSDINLFFGSFTG